MIDIFKLQRPLSSNIEDPPALAYNKDRSVTMMLDMTPDMEGVFGDRLKVYVRGQVEGDKLKILEMVGDRPW